VTELGFLPEERYFFPSCGKKWVVTGKKTFLPRRNWEETAKGHIITVTVILFIPISLIVNIHISPQ